MREIRLALPGDTEDLYVRHQQVWAALRTQVQEGRDFLYRLVTPRVALVRSAALLQGPVVDELPPGRIELDLVASDRVDRNKERPVSKEEIVPWVMRLLMQHGLEARDVAVLRHGVATGLKPQRSEQPAHRIRYGVARIQAAVTISDQRLARAAWREGIGRGRRFGFGMLAAAPLA